MKEVRYDRQLRLWGDHGQSSIESTSVCVIGSSALATEMVKNLVLAGVQRVCIVDDALVKTPDLGQNFFVTTEDMGKPRAEAVLPHLQELNPSVVVESRVLTQVQLANDHLSFLRSFTVVVAANSSIKEGDLITEISDYLFEKGIPFLSTRVCGLMGYNRICVKEHWIIDNHEENPMPDLRLDRPFPELQKFVDSQEDLAHMTSEELKHTPYLLLYFRALQMYREVAKDSTAFPKTYKERQNFIGCLWGLRRPDEKGSLDSENFDEGKAAALRSVQPTTVPSQVKAILSDEKSATDSTEKQTFWLLCHGLRRFVEKHEVLPLSGSLPDMASDTQRYTALARIFHEKAQQDAAEVLTYVREAEQARGLTDNISQEECYQFCKKAAHIRLIRGTPMRGANGLKPILEEIRAMEEAACPPTPAVWLLLLSATLRFGMQKLRYPGECRNMPGNLDFSDLKQRITWIVEENNEDVVDVLSKVGDRAIKEMLRYANSEPHVLCSLIGGIAAQEVIKLATKQYVPLNNTFVYDGHSQNSATFTL